MYVKVLASSDTVQFNQRLTLRSSKSFSTQSALSRHSLRFARMTELRDFATILQKHRRGKKGVRADFRC